jgi:tetratricopeptide (TPR) repeat protein
MPGRKIWIWDLSRAGAIWEGLLTDADGQYTEPQYGRLFNQSDHDFLTPGRTDRWSELWFPYSRLGGPMVKASPWAALNAEPRGEALRIALYALQAIDDDLTVTAGGSEIFRTRVELDPSGVFETSVAMPSGDRPFEVRLGADKLVYTSDPTADDLSRPFGFRLDDESTTEGAYLAADRLHKERRYGEALDKYLACIARDPRHVRALARAAELYARRGQYDKALAQARTALENAMYDPDANYIFGVISRRLGRLADAKEALGWAARSLEHRSNAYGLMAEIAIQERAPERALEYAGRAIESDGDNLNAFDVLATTLRLLNERERAADVLERILKADPLHHLARFERFLLGPDPGRLKAFQSLIQNEFPQETYQELAHYYIRLGLVDDAVRLLELCPASPAAGIWLAYLTRSADPAESAAHLEKALAITPWLVFPFREEDIPAFEWAAGERPGDWTPKYYLALILWSKGRMDEAGALLEQCSEADFAPLFLTRAALRSKDAPGKAEEDLAKAIAIDPQAWRARHALSRFHLDRGRRPEALETTARALAVSPGEVALQSDRVEALLAAGRPGEAAVILDRIEALPSEGASSLHALFVRCRIMMAIEAMRLKDYAAALESLDLAKTYPERLGTGQPFDPDWRLQDYLRAVCLEKMGRTDEAREIKKGIAEMTLKNPGWPGRGRVAGAIVLMELGEGAEARAIAREERPDAELEGWLRAVRRGSAAP